MKQTAQMMDDSGDRERTIREILSDLTGVKLANELAILRTALADRERELGEAKAIIATAKRVMDAYQESRAVHTDAYIAQLEAAIKVLGAEVKAWREEAAHPIGGDREVRVTFALRATDRNPIAAGAVRGEG